MNEKIKSAAVALGAAFGVAGLVGTLNHYDQENNKRKTPLTEPIIQKSLATCDTRNESDLYKHRLKTLLLNLSDSSLFDLSGSDLTVCLDQRGQGGFLVRYHAVYYPQEKVIAVSDNVAAFNSSNGNCYTMQASAIADITRLKNFPSYPKYAVGVQAGAKSLGLAWSLNAQDIERTFDNYPMLKTAPVKQAPAAP